MSLLLNRLKQFMEHYELNYNKVTVAAGLSNGLIGKAFVSGKGLHSESIEKILDAYPALNPTWLFLGEEEMLRAHSKCTPNCRSNCRSISISNTDVGSEECLPNSPPNSEIKEGPPQILAAEGEQQYGYVTKLEFDEMVANQFMSTGARIRAAILELEGKLAASAPPKDPASTGSIPEKAPQKQEPKE